ncbi:MAG TPA: cyclic nucleotide-binding domain-containing protein [Polyangiaceae bacterium]|nr:cyclic nucleotide-binding domain-containing protein [Polyangiaceae bacterium]
MSVNDTERLRRELLLRAMFPTMTRDALVRFAEQAQPLSVATGETVFERGSPPDTIYFVREGRVTMEAEGETAWTFGPRSVVGVIDAMIGRPRARSCVATQDSQLLSLAVSEWLDLLEYDSNTARGSIRNFALQVHRRWPAWASATPALEEPHPRASTPSPLSTYDKILALRRAAFLRPAGMQAIASLAMIAEEESLEAGQVLFPIGSEMSTLRMIVSGNVLLTSENGVSVVQTAGALLGGPAALSGAPTVYSARAVTPARLLRVHEQDYYDQIEEHVRLARSTLSYLVAEFERVLVRAPPTAP